MRVKTYVFVLAAGLSVAGAAVAGIYGWRNETAGLRNPAFDPVVSGSIRASATGSIIAPPAEFSISNAARQRACVAERGGTLQSRSRSFSAPRECDDVWPRLSSVRNWTQGEDGRVTLSDGAGLVVLTLVRKKGLAYEALEPAGAGVALQMLP